MCRYILVQVQPRETAWIVRRDQEAVLWGAVRNAITRGGNRIIPLDTRGLRFGESALTCLTENERYPLLAVTRGVVTDPTPTEECRRAGMRALRRSIERREADGARLAGLKDRQVGKRHSHTVRELGECHAPVV